jgi:hypothetical protein
MEITVQTTATSCFKLIENRNALTASRL